MQFDPPHGVTAWYCEDCADEIDAVVQGPTDSPYESASFKLRISIPSNYPFAPPKVRFTTPIYHPNIDSGGRICLDVLKMPPQGSWKPSQNLSTVLTSIYLLMAEPNPDDGLMPEITKEYRENRARFIEKARASSSQHALLSPKEGGRSQRADSEKEESASSSDEADGAPSGPMKKQKLQQT